MMSGGVLLLGVLDLTLGGKTTLTIQKPVEWWSPNRNTSSSTEHRRPAEPMFHPASSARLSRRGRPDEGQGQGQRRAEALHRPISSSPLTRHVVYCTVEALCETRGIKEWFVSMSARARASERRGIERVTTGRRFDSKSHVYYLHNRTWMIDKGRWQDDKREKSKMPFYELNIQWS